MRAFWQLSPRGRNSVSPVYAYVFFVCAGIPFGLLKTFNNAFNKTSSYILRSIYSSCCWYQLPAVHGVQDGAPKQQQWGMTPLCVVHRALFIWRSWAVQLDLVSANTAVRCPSRVSRITEHIDWVCTQLEWLFYVRCSGENANKETNLVTLYHLCCTAHKKMSFRRCFAQIYDWKHLYLCIFLVRHSVTLPQLQPHFSSENAPPGDGLLGALTTVWQSDSSFRAI